MRSLGLLLLALLVFGLGLAGCESARPVRAAGAKSFVPPRVSPGTGGLSAEELSQAGKLYAGKCIRCHKSYDPADYADPEWRSWMTKMSRKAKLNPDQEQILSRYLEVFRSPAREQP
jgi:hypothetical protein